MTVNTKGVDNAELLQRLINAAADEEEAARLFRLINAARGLLNAASEMEEKAETGTHHVSRDYAQSLINEGQTVVEGNGLDESDYDAAHGKGSVQRMVDTMRGPSK